PTRSRPPAGPHRRRRRGETARAGGARHVRAAARHGRDGQTGRVAGHSRSRGYQERGSERAHAGNPLYPAPSRKKGEVMKTLRWLLVALAVSGCGDRALISAPQSAPPPPQASLLGGLLGATRLLQCSALPYATATQTIGSPGCTIRVGPHTVTGQVDHFSNDAVAW